MRTALIDDHTLAAILRGDSPLPAERRLATTGLWYHRLARSLSSPSVTGSLSRALGRSGAEIGDAAVRAAIRLPPQMELVSLRELAVPMAALIAEGVHLSVLGLEAIAAAEHLDAEIVMKTPNHTPNFQQIADRRGIRLQLLDT